MPIRVVGIDDHPVILEALHLVIEAAADIEWCGHAVDTEGALELIKNTHPDIAVVDISLTDSHGLALIGQIHAAFPEIKVVVFSMHRESAYAERAIRAGALGYVMKSEPTWKVLEGIRRVSNGDVYLSERIASHVLSRVVMDGQRTGVDAFTDQEMVVFQMLGQLFTVKEIAERLDLSPKTVMAYRRQAKEKLGLDTLDSLVHHACRWALGWSLTDAGSPRQVLN
jgi:DNA-binding NarL/FixJ family response regulator